MAQAEWGQIAECGSFPSHNIIEYMICNTCFCWSRQCVLIWVLAGIMVWSGCGEEISEQERKSQVQRQELEKRESMDMKYGENTESLTFGLRGGSDFVLKTDDDQEIKMVLHTYWQQDKIYVSSEYQKGESVRIFVYEDSRIILDNQFYVTWGLKFTARKDSQYLIKFVDEGSMSKLVAAEFTKTAPQGTFSNAPSSDHIQVLSQRLARLKKQMQMMSSVSQFGIVMHEQEAKKLNHSTCLYMTYLLGEVVVIIGIVSMQINLMFKMLSTQNII